MAGVNNLNIYAPVNQAAGGQGKDAGVKNQPDKTKDSFSHVMNDKVRAKDKENDRTKENGRTKENDRTKENGRTKETPRASEETSDKKPADGLSSELKPGEVIPLAELGLVQAMGEATVSVQNIINEMVTVDPVAAAAPAVTVPVAATQQTVVTQENQFLPQEGTGLPAADGILNSNSLADAGLVSNQEGKAPVVTPQTGSAEVPTEILQAPRVSTGVPVTAVQSEAQKTEPVIAEQQAQLTEAAGKEAAAGREAAAAGKEAAAGRDAAAGREAAAAGKEAAAGREAAAAGKEAAGRDVPAGKEVPAGEMKQSSHVQSTEIQSEQTAEVKAEPVTHGAKQTTEAGQTKESEILDIHMLQHAMKEPEAVLPQAEEVVRIKVAEPFNRADDNLVQQLGDKTAQGLLDGKRELTIQLDPEHLGKIFIKITVMNEGVKVLLSCDNQKTLGLLAERSDGIGHIIENNMKSPVVVEVKEDNFWNQQKNATDQHANQNGRQQAEHKENKTDEADGFLQQMRLGLLTELPAM